MTSQTIIDLESLQTKISSGSITREDFKEELSRLNKGFKELQDMLEWAVEVNPQDQDIYHLYRKVASRNASDLVDKLRSYGYVLVSEQGKIKDAGKREELIKAFERQGYRLLELTRLGKREEVQYMLLRIFFSFQLDFPQMLLEPFKLVYSDDMFKVLLFSFLSGVLGQEKANE